MSIAEPVFWKYLADKRDFWGGLRDDAPEEAKLDYEEWLKAEAESEARGIKL